jgi:hypothetical protein
MTQSAGISERDLKALILKIASEVSGGGGVEEDTPLMDSAASRRTRR